MSIRLGEQVESVQPESHIHSSVATMQSMLQILWRFWRVQIKLSHNSYEIWLAVEGTVAGRGGVGHLLMIPLVARDLLAARLEIAQDFSQGVYNFLSEPRLTWSLSAVPICLYEIFSWFHCLKSFISLFISDLTQHLFSWCILSGLKFPSLVDFAHNVVECWHQLTEASQRNIKQ
jgi:hypothetical protein